MRSPIFVFLETDMSHPWEPLPRKTFRGMEPKVP